MNEEPFLVVSPSNSMLANGNSMASQSSLLQRITKLVQENDSLKKCLVENNLMVKKMLSDISKWKTTERHQNNQTVLQLKSRIMTLERQLQMNSNSDLTSTDFQNGAQTMPKDINGTRNPQDTPKVRVQDLSQANDGNDEMNNLRKINMFLTQTLQKYKGRIEELENNQPSVEVFQVSSSEQRVEVDTLKTSIGEKSKEIGNLTEEIKELEEQLSCMCEKVDEIELENCQLKEQLLSKNVQVHTSSEDASSTTMPTTKKSEQSDVAELKEQVISLNSSIAVKGENLEKSFASRIEKLEKELEDKDILLEDSKAKLEQTREMFDTLSRSHKKALKEYTDLWSEMESKVAAASKIGELRATQEKEASKAIIELNKKLSVKDMEIENMMVEQANLKETLSRYSQVGKELDAERENVQLLKMQMDLYKTDFQAERSARETQNSEILALKEQLQELAKQNDRLKLDLEMLSSGELARPMRSNNHAMMASQWQEPVPSIYGNQPYNTQETQQRNLNGRGVPIYNNPTWNMSYSDTALPETEPETSIPCPQCRKIFPDIDSLQMHMMHCFN